MESRYFIVKSCNRENLELSVQQGVWATQRSNEAKLNEAFDSVENVILIFSVNRTRHFQVSLGCKSCICCGKCFVDPHVPNQQIPHITFVSYTTKLGQNPCSSLPCILNAVLLS